MTKNLDQPPEVVSGGSRQLLLRRAKARPVRLLLVVLAALTALTLAQAVPVAAQPATWLFNPGSGDFNTGTNWNPATVPTGTAFFGESNTRDLSFGASTTIGGWTFNPGASDYTFTLDSPRILTLTGAGIDIQGGSATISNNESMFFENSSTAGSANITNNGLLYFSSASTAGSANITNNGLLYFSSASTAGSATITNQGVLVFFDTSNANNATITTGSGATTRLSGSGSGDNAQFITNSGGTFQIVGITAGFTTVGSIAGAGHFVLGDKELRVGGNNLSTMVSGMISGFGSSSLRKIGTGTLTLSGINTYTGATFVDGGILRVNGSIGLSNVIVNSGGTLGGAGTVGITTIASGGVFAPGSSIGAITVDGNLTFAPGAIYAIDVSPTDADRANVTGAATLTGATVHATAVPGSFRGRTYKILSAGGGLGGTQFAGLITTGGFSPARNPHLTYDANNVYFVLDPGSIVLPPRANRNQTEVASGINRAVEAGATPLAAFDALLNMADKNLTDALTQLSGEHATSAATGGIQMKTQFLMHLLNPNAGGAALTNPRWSVWVQPYGGYNRIDGDDAIGSANTSARTWGALLGFGYQAAPDLRIGIAISGGGANWSLSRGLGGGESAVFKISPYVRKEFGPAYLSAALSYAWHDKSLDRTVTVAGLDKLATSFSAHSFGGRLDFGYRLQSSRLGITPYAALQVQSFRTPSFREKVMSGADTFALNYEARTTTAIRTELGTWFDRRIALDHGNELSLRARAAWVYDHSDDREMAAAFQTLPGTTFTVRGAQPGEHSALLSAGAELRLAGNWSVGARLDGEFARGSQTFATTGTLRFRW